MFSNKNLAVLFAVLVLVVNVVVMMVCGAEMMALHHEHIHEPHIIEAINRNEKVPWMARVYDRFANMTVGEFKSNFMGLIPKKKDNSRFNIGVGAGYVPATSFDSRTRWPACAQPIRYQNTCGCCWAFSASKAFGERLCIATNGATKVIMSPQIQVSCNKENMACSGGYIDATWDYFMKTGGVSEQCVPYVSGNTTVPECPAKCHDGSVPVRYKISNAARLKDMTAMMYELEHYGPIQATMDIYKDFVSYSSGVYSHTTGNMMGGHAVVIVGFGVDSHSKKPYWTVANSWSDKWGDKGFFNIIRGTNECGIESNAWAPTIENAKK